MILQDSHSFGVHPEIHSGNEPTEYPDFDATAQERPITPPGVDYDFDPETISETVKAYAEHAWRVAAAGLRQQSRNR